MNFADKLNKVSINTSMVGSYIILFADHSGMWIVSDGLSKLTVFLFSIYISENNLSQIKV